MNFSEQRDTKCFVLYHVSLDLGSFCLLFELNQVNLFELLLPILAKTLVSDVF